MSRPYIRHIASEMTDRVQHCVICGEIISDYRNASWPDGQDPPKGWPLVEIYVRQGNPTLSTTLYPDGETVINCECLKI